MTKKDYIAIAEAIIKLGKRYGFDHGYKLQKADNWFLAVIWELEQPLKNDNPLFNEQKFVDYINKGLES